MTRRNIRIARPLILTLAVVIAAGLPGCRPAGDAPSPPSPEAESLGAGADRALPASPEGAPPPDRRSDLRWESMDGESLTLVGPRGVLWRFRYGPDLDGPSFHPLNTPDGPTLTADRPADHLWHHGLWFSWKFINGVNYWEHDAATGRPAGRTSRRNVCIVTGDDGSARMTMALTYAPAADRERDPVLREDRLIAVLAPDAEGTVTIDWYGRFTAVGDVVLDRTPLPGEPGGQIWGGYSGLSARLAEGLADRVIMTVDGPVLDMPDDRYRGRHTAMDYSGLLDGEPAGIAVIDHPANPRSPTPWYVIRSEVMSFFTPAVLCYGPMTLRAGESFALGYRVLVHSGRWDEARLRKEYERFRVREVPPASKIHKPIP